MHDLQALWNLPVAPSDAFGQQQSLVRQVNDRIAEVAGELGADEVDFLCECSAPDVWSAFRSRSPSTQRFVL
jgi:hypothetical protein